MAPIGSSWPVLLVRSEKCLTLDVDKETPNIFSKTSGLAPQSETRPTCEFGSLDSVSAILIATNDPPPPPKLAPPFGPTTRKRFKKLPFPRRCGGVCPLSHLASSRLTLCSWHCFSSAVSGSDPNRGPSLLQITWPDLEGQ